MKKIYIALMASLVAVSCEKYDDGALNSRLDKVESDGAALKGEIDDLVASKADLEARLLSMDAVVSVETWMVEDGREGYKITFAESEPIVILNGKDGEDGVKGDKGEDGVDGTGVSADGEKGDTGATGDAGADAYVKYTDNGDNVTIKLWNAASEAYDSYTFDKVLPPVAVDPFLFLGDGSGLVELSGSESTVAIGLPNDLAEADYKAIIVEVVSAEGSGSSVVTKSGSYWSVTIAKPTFSADGIYNGDAEFEIEPAKLSNDSGVITVTYVAADGSKIVESVRFTYSVE